MDNLQWIGVFSLLLLLILTPIVLGGAVGRYIRAARNIRGIVRKGRGLCPRCGYDLTRNVSGVCPECGEKVKL